MTGFDKTITLVFYKGNIGFVSAMHLFFIIYAADTPNNTTSVLLLTNIGVCCI